ncbi:MAG: tetratricopeptide repeat protein [Candidatus Anammoxibacter sp.]
MASSLIFFDKDKTVPTILEGQEKIEQNIINEVKHGNDNIEKILERLNKGKGVEQNLQLIEEQKKKIEGLENELNILKSTDERAEIALSSLQDGDLEAARKLFETLREEERTKEKEHAKTAYNLGNVYFIELKFQDALQAFLDAANLNPENPLYLSESGTTFYQLAQYDKAISYYEEALESDLKTFGENHPRVARNWDNLGSAWDSKGDYDKAISYYEKALMVLIKKLGKEHPSTKTVLGNLNKAKAGKGN